MPEENIPPQTFPGPPASAGDSMRDVFTAARPVGQSWRDRIKVHPAADLFPMIEGDELIALGEDIRKHGLRQPIVFHAEDTRPDTDASYKADGTVSQVIAAKNALQLPLLD